MNDPKETQQELFGEFSATPRKPERFPLISRTQKPILFSTNTEQLLMAGILFILVLCGVFFLGVIRGKSLAGQPITEAPIRERAEAPGKPVLAPVAASPAPARTAPALKAASQALPVPTANIASKPYTLGLVTHRKKELAEAEMNTLRAQGFYSFIKADRDYFQVCVGQYASKEEAKKDLALFSAKYKDCYLRRR